MTIITLSNQLFNHLEIMNLNTAWEKIVLCVNQLTGITIASHIKLCLMS